MLEDARVFLKDAEGCAYVPSIYWRVRVFSLQMLEDARVFPKKYWRMRVCSLKMLKAARMFPKDAALSSR